MARFQPLSVQDLTELIVRQGIVETADEATRIASQADGSIATVANWTNEELKAFRQELFHHLVQRPLDFTKLAKAVQGNMESVGTESQPRRERLKVLLDFAMQFYRSAMQTRLQSDSNEAQVESNSSEPTLSPTLDASSFIAAIKRCIEAREHLDRMVSPASLIEAWAADLAVISRA
jgi:paraquat-inducible protein B